MIIDTSNACRQTVSLPVNTAQTAKKARNYARQTFRPGQESHAFRSYLKLGDRAFRSKLVILHILLKLIFGNWKTGSLPSVLLRIINASFVGTTLLRCVEEQYTIIYND